MMRAIWHNSMHCSVGDLTSTVLSIMKSSCCCRCFSKCTCTLAPSKALSPCSAKLASCFAGFMTLCVSLLQFFQTNRFRAFRASLFAALGLWGIFPGLHTLLLYWHVPDIQQAFLSDLIMGAIYLVSAPQEDEFGSTAGRHSWLQPCLVLAVAFPNSCLLPY